jgi:hypothetical protein
VDAGTDSSSLRVKFIAAWALLVLAKLWLAYSLPLFGDEAFYALESRRLAWAYSDLPGLTAWLIRLGTELGGQTAFAVRLPFLMLGAALPWLVVRIARRWLGEPLAWQAGLLALLMPLSGLMGVLALPDVPMLFATLVCLDAFASLLRRVGPAAALQLALGLVIGALAHYRFALVVLAGAVGVLCTARGRALLREPVLWGVLAVGAAAWWPLLAWNLGNAGAGLSFQFVERHPWQFAWSGLWWLPVQALVVTPVLFILLCLTLGAAWGRRTMAGEEHWPLLLGIAAVSVVGYFLLGFVADSERVSFHWPLAGWLALACVAPAVLVAWPAWARRLLHATAAIGLVAAIAYLAIVAKPEGRQWLAGGEFYADNFSGWDAVSRQVRSELASMPTDTRLVADNFMLGAQLAFALDRDDIRVLEHPANIKHGRALQLDHWGLLSAGRSDWGGSTVLLVVEDGARPLRLRLDGYRELCRRSGGLPPPRVLNVDRGRKRFLLFRLPAPSEACSMPALAWFESPLPNDEVAGVVAVTGWALKESVGIGRVELMLDGAPVAQVDYGVPRADVLEYWKVHEGSDRVGFRTSLDLSGHPGGEAWLGLRIHGLDGSIEDWPQQRIRVRPQGSR